MGLGGKFGRYQFLGIFGRRICVCSLPGIILEQSKRPSALAKVKLYFILRTCRGKDKGSSLNQTSLFMGGEVLFVLSSTTF